LYVDKVLIPTPPLLGTIYYIQKSTISQIKLKKNMMKKCIGFLLLMNGFAAIGTIIGVQTFRSRLGQYCHGGITFCT
jgi:hypothetical protein